MKPLIQRYSSNGYHSWNKYVLPRTPSILLVSTIYVLILLSCSLIECQQQSFPQGPFIDNRLRTFQSLWTPQEILPNLYNNQQAPSVNSTPIQVDLDIRIISIRPSSDESVQKFDIFLIQRWDDFRLQSPRGLPIGRKIVLDRRWKDILWIPSLYFKKSVEPTSNNGLVGYMTISNRTSVELSTRTAIDLLCNTDLSRYPFNELTCSLEVALLSETLENVILKWNQFTLDDNLQAGEFRVASSSRDHCISNHGRGIFSCLKAEINLVRRIGSHLISRYFPSFLMVLLAFGGFWIPTCAHAARVTIIMTSLLILTVQQYGFASNGNGLHSNLYALNVWYFLCEIFIFSCLLEYALALSDSLSAGSLAADKQGQQTATLFESKFFQAQPKLFKDLLKPSDHNSIIDMISRITFPSLFLFVTFIYILFYAI